MVALGDSCPPCWSGGILDEVGWITIVSQDFFQMLLFLMEFLPLGNALGSLERASYHSSLYMHWVM